MASKPLRSFRDGFIGAFALAGSLILAVVAAASSFVNHGDAPEKNHGTQG